MNPKQYRWNIRLSIIFGIVIGLLLGMTVVGIIINKMNEKTITFQTDSPYFNDCKGNEIGEFVFVFGTMDCEDLGLEDFPERSQKTGS